jgi:enterochelin esterase-like enzyme
VAPPTVISVSFGPQWLLTEVVRGDRPTAMQLFLKEVMPQVEEKIGGVKGRRLLQGESMGGFNASQLLLKTDHLFERVALLCPGMSAVGPFASKQEVEDFFARNQPHINRDWVQRILEWMKSEFPTPQDWANHNAIEQASQLNGRSPATYVSCGQQDEYGFFEAAQKFVERANSRGASIQWEPMKGGHCVFNTQAIAEFFVPAKKAPKSSEGHSSLH